MMATHNIINSSINDRSPASKRAKYELKPNSNSSRWSLTSNEVELNSVHDLGIGRLDNVGSSLKCFGNCSYHADNFCLPPYTPRSKAREVSALEASLPDDTLRKLISGELDHVIFRQSSNAINSDNTNNINHFGLLSDEMILCILQKLPKAQLKVVSLVCRRFRRLAEDESLWTRMDISNDTLEAGTLGLIISRQVIILRLARSEIQYPPILPNSKAFSQDFRWRLMYLDLSMAMISPNSLAMIFTKCKRLKKLSLENVPVNEEVLTALAGNKDVEVINFAMSTGIEKNGLKYLLTNCRKIRELNMSWTYLSTSSISYICENLPSSLDRFNFSGCRKFLTNKNVCDLVSNCPNIRELDLSDCTALTGEAIRQITVLEDLNFLALSRCYQIPYRSLLNLKKVKNLSYLDIHGGYIDDMELKLVKDCLGDHVNINKFKFSSVARPTVGLKKSSIWNMRVRDY